ncbi:LysR substrate-binding domain-containing protein [Virgisporangium ochraceum]
MQVPQLRSFVAVAELRHFTRAADRVGITQPSLSKQIHALEADLGAALFERGTAVALTPAGEVLLPIATRILADLDTAHREVQNLIGLRRGRIRLGATPSLCVSLVPPLLRRFHADHPGVEIHIEESGSQDLVRDLARGALDLALVVLPNAGPDLDGAGLTAEPLLRENLVVASLGPLPGVGGTIRVTDLADHQLVMFRAGYDLRDATLDACRQAGFTPTFAVEGGEMDAVLSLVEAGLGAGVTVGVVVAGRPRLHVTPFAAPGLRRTVALAHRRDLALPHSARALRDTLITQLHGGNLPPGVEPIPAPR